MTGVEEQAAEVLAARMGRGSSGRFIAEYGETPETLAAVLAPVFAEHARQALLDVADARDVWQAELNRQDERHYATGSMHGAGPDVACDVFEDFLRERADTYAEGGEQHG